MTNFGQPTKPGGIKPAGWVVIILLFGALGYGVYYFFFAKNKPASDNQGTPMAGQTYTGEAIEIGVAYGSAKKLWMEQAVERFKQTPDGARIKINLIPKGSQEAADLILRDPNKAHSIHVWSPDSSLWKDIFIQEWQATQGATANPFHKEETLVLSPQVFVMWKARYDAFIAKYKEVSFKTIAAALKEPGGWQAIAGKPEWGIFKYGHSHPRRSNSGLTAIVTEAYEFSGKTQNLTLSDILNTGFQQWFTELERSVTGMSDSTSRMMLDMIQKGPSSYDILSVYEATAIENLRNAQGRWGDLQVIYPKHSMWADSPYYILNAPWVSDKHKAAAEAFLNFLMSEQIQVLSLNQGFRPGNPQVPVMGVSSPFETYQQYGLKVDIGQVCASPGSEVVQNLLTYWERTAGRR